MQVSPQDDYIITYTDGSTKEKDQDQNTEQGQDGWHTGRGYDGKEAGAGAKEWED